MKNECGRECWGIYRGKGVARKFNAWELPRRKHTTFRTQREFEIKNKSGINEFYIHGSVHRESNLLTVQQDTTYSVYYISVGNTKYFGC